MYSEICPIYDGVSFEPIPMNYDNVLRVKSRICKAVIRMCIEQQAAYSRWIIDFRNPNVINIINEFADDIFESLVDMSSPYNMYNSMDELSDIMSDMSVSSQATMQTCNKRVFLTQYELWNICCADSMMHNSRGEQHIGRILGLLTFEMLTEYVVPYEDIRSYLSELLLYPDDYHYSDPIYLSMNAPEEYFPYNTNVVPYRSYGNGLYK